MVEQWSNIRLLSATVDQIPLGAMIYKLGSIWQKTFIYIFQSFIVFGCYEFDGLNSVAVNNFNSSLHIHHYC